MFELQYNNFFSLRTSLFPCIVHVHYGHIFALKVSHDLIIGGIVFFFFPLSSLNKISSSNLSMFLDRCHFQKTSREASKVHKETQYKEIVCTVNNWSGMLTASSNFGKLLYI